jgi:putative ABC transport system substrate-binding protein
MFSFRQGLSAGGFVEDRNVVVDYRYAQGQPSRLPLLAPIWFDVRRPSS